MQFSPEEREVLDRVTRASPPEMIRRMQIANGWPEPPDEPAEYAHSNTSARTSPRIRARELETGSSSRVNHLKVPIGIVRGNVKRFEQQQQSTPTLDLTKQEAPEMSQDEHEEEFDAGSDMQMSPSDGDPADMDMDDEDNTQQDAEDIEVVVDDDDAMQDDEGLEDKDVEVESEDEEDAGSDEEALSSPPPEPAPQPRLKIKLKLPHAALSSGAPTGATTPDGSVRFSRRGASRDLDVESEDSDDEDASTRSASVSTTAGRPLTARQAVLANVVDSSHVSLAAPPNPRKKKPLTELEAKLKREETARKRRNLTEKKLEDEKAETINRLLKKQSRGRGKRSALSTADDRPTPGASTSNLLIDGEANDGGAVSREPAVPTAYRWISTSRPHPGKADDGERSMCLSFSVPTAVFPSTQEQPSGAAPMDVDSSDSAPRAQKSSLCDLEGCTERRKYRLVKDWHRGACGMGHLKILEARLA